MTSREKTGFLPRDLDDSHPPLPVKNRALVGAFGAITWPWLLSSLRGGSMAEKHRLLSRLDLADDALPNLGSWKADTGFLHCIVDLIEAMRPAVVVEFGCGATSLVTAAALKKFGGGRLIGFDQHADFVEATQAWLTDHGLDSDLRYGPLAPAPAPWPGFWYQTRDLPEAIDMIIVDGPPWNLHPLTRAGAASLFDRLKLGGALLLDDAARPGERIVAARWRKAFPNMRFHLWKGGSKGTLIGKRIG